MPRGSRAKPKATVDDDDENVAVVDLTADENVTPTTLLPPMISIPFLTDKEEEIPTYVVEISKSARAIWYVPTCEHIVFYLHSCYASCVI